MVGVPLNIMCSKRCAMPVIPSRSFELPTCATQPPETVGSSWRSTSSSRIPLARSFSTTGTFCAGSGSAQCRRKTTVNNFHAHPVRVPTRQVLSRYAMLVRQPYAGPVQLPNQKPFGVYIVLLYLLALPGNSDLRLYSG